MNYRQLQNILKQVRDIHGETLDVSLNSSFDALSQEWSQWCFRGYGIRDADESRNYVVLSPQQFKNAVQAAGIKNIADIKAEAKKAPFNAHIEMWSLLARASEILIGVVTLDNPDDYRDHIVALSSKLGKFIYFCVGYRFNQWENDKITDDLETCKELQRSGDYDMARKYLTSFWRSFYVPRVDLYHSPYCQSVLGIINRHT